MTGILFLAWKHVAHHRARTILLVLSVSVAVAIPLAATILVERHQAELVARADVTPLVAGARANRFDLALGALYFRQAELRPIPLDACDEMREFGVVIPINIRSTAQGIPVVATAPEYFEQRDLRPRRGTLPLMNGDVVLGANAARTLGLAEGDHLFSDPVDLYDISKPSSLRMLVTGILARTGTPDDDVVFTDIDTAWIMEGLAHGHEAEVDEDLVMARTEDVTVISPSMVEFNEINEDNAWSFHLHADASKLPLSAVIVYPRDDKASTILKARMNASETRQMIVPRAVIDDLLAIVFRVKRLVDGIAIVLGASTIILIALVMALTMKIREPEMRTLHRIGCPRHTVVLLHGTELAMILGGGVALGALWTAIALLFTPDLVSIM